MRVRAHGLALHRPPGLGLRQAVVEPLPSLAGVARDISSRFAIGAGARPHGGAVHREHPRGIGVARVHHHGKADVADALGHGPADTYPGVGRAVEPVNAAVILLIQAIRVARAESHTVRIVKGDVGGVESFDHFHALHKRREAAAAVARFVHAAARHGEIKMLGVARVDDDGVQLGSVRRAVLHAASP